MNGRKHCHCHCHYICSYSGSCIRIHIHIHPISHYLLFIGNFSFLTFIKKSVIANIWLEVGNINKIGNSSFYIRDCWLVWCESVRRGEDRR